MIRRLASHPDMCRCPLSIRAGHRYAERISTPPRRNALAYKRYPVTLFRTVYGYGEKPWPGSRRLNLADLTGDTPITVQVCAM